MPTQHDIDHQKQQLLLWRNQVRHYQNQRAIHGDAFVPPGVVTSIATARVEIARCKATLRGWGYAVEDLPEDGDVAPQAPPLAVEPGELAPYAFPPVATLPPFILQPTRIYEPHLTLLEWLSGWRHKHHPAEWRFVRRWISATILGWLSVGILTGPLQGLALRKRMGRHHPDMTLFWLIVVFLVVPALVWTEIAWLGGFWGGAAGGVLLGILQWIDLRRAALPTGLPHWLIANGLGGGIAQSLIVGAWHGGMPSPDLLSLRATPIVALAAVLFALITGVTLGWLLHQRLPEE